MIKEKPITSSSLADVSVETWTFHHDFCEKTEERRRREMGEVLEDEEKETLILGRERMKGSRWMG